MSFRLHHHSSLQRRTKCQSLRGERRNLPLETQKTETVRLPARQCRSRSPLPFLHDECGDHNLTRGLGRLCSLIFSDDNLESTCEYDWDQSDTVTPWHGNKEIPSVLYRSWDELRDLCNKGQLEKAISLLFHMNATPSEDIYVRFLKLCAKKKDLKHAKKIKNHLIQHGLELNGLLGDYLVVTLANCGALEEALNQFHELTTRSVFSWTAVISACAEHGHGEEALQMHRCMLNDGVEPSSHTFVSLFKACGSITDIEYGKRLHSNVCKRGFTVIIFTANAIVNMYGKCGALAEAEAVFQELSERDIVTWNTMLAAYLHQGEAGKIIFLYRQMQEDNVEPDQYTFVCVLQACNGLLSKEVALFPDEELLEKITFDILQALHADAYKRKFATDIFVGTALLSMYAKLGEEKDVVGVFNDLHSSDIVSWNAMMSAYIEQDQSEKALLLYRQMQVQGLHPNELTFIIALKACGCIAEKQDSTGFDRRATVGMPLEVGKLLHIDAEKNNFASNSLFATALLSLYGKCGALSEAEDTFAALHGRDVVSWNVLLLTYVQHGYGERALLLYRQMHEQHVFLNQHTLVSGLQACGIVAESEDAFVVEGQLIKATALEIGMTLHASARKQCLTQDIFVSNTLVSMYGKCGAIMHAENVFAASPQHDIVSWNSILSAYLYFGWVAKALQSYGEMQREGLSPDHLTYVTLLQACGILAEKDSVRTVTKEQSLKVVSFNIGQALCSDAYRKGYASNEQFVNTIISMYGKCGAIHEAEVVFRQLSPHTIVSWTAMISAYVERGFAQKAFELYNELYALHMSANELTFAIILQACGILAEKEVGCNVQGRVIKVMSLGMVYKLHMDAIMKSYESEILVGTLLLTIYGKCQAIVEAENVFDMLPCHDINSWNAMLSIYVAYGQVEKALQFYILLDRNNMSLDDVTHLSLLQVCCETGNLELCYEIHFYLVCARYDQISSIGTTLIHAYGSCANVVEGDAVLYSLNNPDLVAWTACISGCAEEGMFSSRNLIFENSYLAGMMPDGVIFTSLLSTCSHTGLVAEGLKYFELMSREFGIVPELRHYNAIVDLLGRAGDFRRVSEVLERIPVQDDPSFWLSLLGSCRLHGNMQLAKRAFNNAMKSEPEQAAAYVLMSNIEFQEWATSVEEFDWSYR